MSDDLQLLRDYATRRSEPAFAELVRRHIDLVYSTALRSVNWDTHLAEDVVQQVFADLARKAGRMQQGVVLSGWLYQAARHAAANAVRGERRRREREREAVAIQKQFESTDWSRIVPELDEAMARLPAADRDAVILRYFEQQQFDDVGRTLGISEEAARKRVTRALEKLRGLLDQRGAALSESDLAATMSASSVQSAPATLAVAVTAKAMAAATSTGTVSSLIKIMTITKTKMTVVAIVLAVAITAPLTVNYERHRLLTSPVPYTSAEDFRQKNLDQIDNAKYGALAMILYASYHNDRFPGQFTDLRDYLPHSGRPAELFANQSEFEIVYSGSWKEVKNPASAILLREKRPRLGPDGIPWRAYAFVDGHVEDYRAENGSFKDWEASRAAEIDTNAN